jgi:hypothetical protein
MARLAFGWSRFARVPDVSDPHPVDLDCLDRDRFVAKTTANACWISFDFLGFSRANRDFSMGYTDFSSKEFSSPFICGVGTARPAGVAFGMRKSGAVHARSLLLFPISCNQLSSTALGANRLQATPILAAAQQTRPTSLAEAPRSDLARRAPPSLWRGPPLSDG